MKAQPVRLKVRTPCSDAELKAMRDAVYPATSPDARQSREGWDHCKPNWREDEAWLTEQYFKSKAQTG